MANGSLFQISTFSPESGSLLCKGSRVEGKGTEGSSAVGEGQQHGLGLQGRLRGAGAGCPARGSHRSQGISACSVPPSGPCPGQHLGFWCASRLRVHKLCESAFEHRGVPGIVFHLSPVWQWLLLKERTCLFKLVTSHVNTLKVTVDFFTRGCPEILNCSRPSGVEESHFQGFGKTFPTFLHWQPSRRAKSRVSQPMFSQQHVLYSGKPGKHRLK